MSPKKLLLFGIALVAGLGTVFMARSILQPPPPPPPAAPQQVVRPAPEPDLRILIASANLPAGRLIQPDDLVWRVWDREDERLPSYFVEGGEKPGDLHGAVVRRGIGSGDPLIQGLVVKPGEQGFLAAVMEPGKRAVSVRINPVTGIAGLVFPGDRVDLLLTQSVSRPNDPRRSERYASETVLTDLRVLAIDQSTDDQTATPKQAEIVTLEVTPKQAELVILISELGQLSLSLRSLQGEPDQLVAALPTGESQGVELHSALGYGVVASQSSGAVAGLAGGLPLTGPLAAPLKTGLSARGQGATDPELSSDLAALLAGLTPTERAAALRSLNDRPYSWDSDVSLLLPNPSDATSSVRKVQVLRGPEAAVIPFQR
ncbi:Flp pilus assembly protein CpaB [Algihabitans albus]|uniref:Flp pilus assembly protein CpaB n=1 Tax=Algihabitans albus TaxID=2164067 RepID=UPI000E5C8501|nr:Flp pilus assembly protein CpaB [Algihabitans albus]